MDEKNEDWSFIETYEDRMKEFKEK